MTGPAAASDVQYQVLEFDQLDGWADDDHAAALKVFRNTCRDMKDIDWRAVCKFAETDPSPRDFFEMFFRPVLIDDGQDAMFTGYFEPELDGDLYQSSRYQYPIYAIPPEALVSNPWLSRRDILGTDVMKGRGLEIAWVDDPVELFFLQIQGLVGLNYQMAVTSALDTVVLMAIRTGPSASNWSGAVCIVPIKSALM